MFLCEIRIPSLIFGDSLFSICVGRVDAKVWFWSHLITTFSKMLQGAPDRQRPTVTVSRLEQIITSTAVPLSPNVLLTVLQSIPAFCKSTSLPRTYSDIPLASLTVIEKLDRRTWLCGQVGFRYKTSSRVSVWLISWLICVPHNPVCGRQNSTWTASWNNVEFVIFTSVF